MLSILKYLFPFFFVQPQIQIINISSINPSATALKITRKKTPITAEEKMSFEDHDTWDLGNLSGYFYGGGNEATETTGHLRFETPILINTLPSNSLLILTKKKGSISVRMQAESKQQQN